MMNQLLAALMAKQSAGQSAPGPMLTQPPMRDPVATMNGVGGGGAGGIGGGGGGFLGGLDPVKLAQLQALMQGKQGGVNPYTYGLTSTGTGGPVGNMTDSAGNLMV